MLASVTFTIGLLIVLIAGPWGMYYVSPGRLSSPHEAILAPEGSNANCAVCHSAAQAGLVSWVEAAFTSETAVGESTKCLNCHFDDRRTARPYALVTHSEAPIQLVKKTDGATKKNADDGTALSVLVSLTGGPPMSSLGELACATCHREHHGSRHDLAHVNDTQCQVCHARRFSSFAEGHPEFKPIRRIQSGLNFDHVSHKQTNFGDANFQCIRCHRLDTDAGTMRLEPFPRSCAGCHSQGKVDHHGNRIKSQTLKLFQLPEMEFNNAQVYWPEDAAVGEELTPMMRFLLAGDDSVLRALQSLQEENVDWIPFEWKPDAAELKAEMASAIKQVVHDFVGSDENALIERIAKALGGKPNEPVVAGLTEQLSSARYVVLAYQNRWLPNLADELAGRRIEQEANERRDRSLPAGASGWLIDSELVSVSYRPTGHADAFLRGWIDALARHAAGDLDDAQEGNASRRTLRMQLFEELTSKKAGGFLYSTCLRCHAVDRTEGTYRVNWLAAGHETKARGYSMFDHRPHLLLLKGDGACQHCHQLADTSAIHAGVPRGMLPHAKNQCTSCHNSKRTGDNCLTCHKYHFGRP